MTMAQRDDSYGGPSSPTDVEPAFDATSDPPPGVTRRRGFKYYGASREKRAVSGLFGSSDKFSENTGAGSPEKHISLMKRYFLVYRNEETQAVACVSMWCNRMLVNGSTANFEPLHYCKSHHLGQALFHVESC